MTNLARSVSLTVVLTLALGACGGSEAPPAQAPSSPGSSAPPTKQQEAKPQPTEAKPEKPTYDVDFVEAKQSPRLKKAPRVTIDVPGYDQFLPTSLVKATRVRYKVQGWKDAPEGSYLQFVFDGKPFRPVTDPKEKIMLTDIAGGEDVAEGEHIIAVFACRPNHESIKSEHGIAVRRFYVGKRIKGGWNRSSDPLLVVGSPYGTYKDDVLLDWYVLNASISSNEYSVRAHLEGPGIKPEGIQRVITDWKPWIILSAHEGAEYSVKLELLDPQGEPVPYGTYERKFSVKP